MKGILGSLYTLDEIFRTSLRFVPTFGMEELRTLFELSSTLIAGESTESVKLASIQLLSTMFKALKWVFILNFTSQESVFGLYFNLIGNHMTLVPSFSKLLYEFYSNFIKCFYPGFSGSQLIHPEYLDQLTVAIFQLTIAEFQTCEIQKNPKRALVLVINSKI